MCSSRSSFEGWELALGPPFVKWTSNSEARLAAHVRESSYNDPMDPELFAELARRRAEIISHLQSEAGQLKAGEKGPALLLFSAPVHLRNGDVEHSYRQHSDFFYLSGFEEPECALLLLADEPNFVLFVRKRDREREIWDGFRAGTEGAMETFGATTAHPMEELSQLLPEYLEGRSRLFYLLGEREQWDRVVFDAVRTVRGRRRRKVRAPSELVDARGLLHEMRLRKSPFEQRKMLEVGQIAAGAHRAAMNAAVPNMSEWELQNVIELEFRKNGSRRVAYDSIVGSGPNATILHYRESERTMMAGDLVLIDAGAEKDFFASDITRTFPVSGTFSPVQKRLYELVLRSQEAALSATKPGATLDEIHEAAFAVLRQGVVDEGLLGETDSSDDKAVDERVRRFYMHRTSHFLGMDVHDVGEYYVDGEPRKLEPGMVITVEPGLYFAVDDETVPEEYRGIGIRIEDDILVVDGGYSNLTESAPKTVEQIEAACRGV